MAITRRMENGPTALEAIFREIEPWHLLDPKFEYQDRVESWALTALEANQNRDALWSLALINVLRNRPNQAADWFGQIQCSDGTESWAHVFRLAVLIANWQTCKASWLASDQLNNIQSDQQKKVITALRDLARSGCLDPRGPIGLLSSLRPAVETISNSIKGSLTRTFENYLRTRRTRKKSSRKRETGLSEGARRYLSARTRHLEQRTIIATKKDWIDISNRSEQKNQRYTHKLHSKASTNISTIKCKQMEVILK